LKFTTVDKFDCRADNTGVQFDYKIYMGREQEFIKYCETLIRFFDAEFVFENAKLVIPKKKERLSMRIDSDVLSWFKERGKGYQTIINSVLKSYVEAQKSQS
jgi:uncharacterized protein (DUF4415 family)